MRKSGKLSKVEPATLEKIAVLDYEPFDADMELPSDEEWAKLADPHLVVARLSLAMCKKTKSELSESIERANSISEFDVLMKRIKESKDFFQGFADVLKQAELRCTVAAAAKLEEKGRQ